VNPRKSVAEILVAGNPRRLTRQQLAERAADSTTLILAFGVPEIPDALSPAAKKVWRETVELLGERGTLTKGDGPLLAIFATVSARRLEAQRELDEHGLIVDGKENPAIRIVEACERRLPRLARELGLVLTTDQRKRVEASARAMQPKPGSAADFFPELVKEADDVDEI